MQKLVEKLLILKFNLFFVFVSFYAGSMQSLEVDFIKMKKGKMTVKIIMLHAYFYFSDLC